MHYTINMIRYKISFVLQKDYKNKSFHLIFQETLKMLNWKMNDIRCSIFIRIDESLPIRGGRVIHRNGKHIILIHPLRNKPFPWDTIRHEFFHSALKSKIKSRLNKHAISLPTPKNYQSQTFRENLEEYCVRALQILFIQQKNGAQWVKKQIAHEVRQGFALMPSVVDFFRQWRKTKKSFSRETFIELICFLN